MSKIIHNIEDLKAALKANGHEQPEGVLGFVVGAVTRSNLHEFQTPLFNPAGGYDYYHFVRRAGHFFYVDCEYRESLFIDCSK